MMTCRIRLSHNKAGRLGDEVKLLLVSPEERMVWDGELPPSGVCLTCHFKT